MNTFKSSTRFLLIFSLISLLFSASAFAQDEDLPSAGEATGNASSGNVQYEKESVYDFDGDDVEGAIVKPDEANISGENHGKTSSLIQIRTDFIPELIQSVETL